MNDSDKINMEISIGSQHVKLTVPFNEQDFVRDVEKELGGLFKAWRLAFPRKDERELLAMIAYRYASYYNELKAKHSEALKMILDCEDKIDAISSESQL